MEKLCMYTKKTEPEVTFLSGEHIFPAGIGGKQKLPVEYVSHEINNSFSKMELFFLRDSFPSMSRQFVGPGKRGNLNPKKATKSKVCLMNSVSQPNKIGFGYISLGIPYSISQVNINIDGTINFMSDQSLGDSIEQVQAFNQKLGKYNGKHILYKDDRLSKDEFILGHHENKWYLALNNIELISEIDKYIGLILTQKKLHGQEPTCETGQVNFHQSVQFDDRYLRVCAKIIFNYLGYAKGRDFVLKECFDPLRNWIVNGGENTFANLIGKEINLGTPFPENSHRLLISQSGNSLNALITFYGNQSGTAITLTEEFNDRFETDGFICDWENQDEYTLKEYIVRLGSKGVY